MRRQMDFRSKFKACMSEHSIATWEHWRCRNITENRFRNFTTSFFNLHSCHTFKFQYPLEIVMAVIKNPAPLPFDHPFLTVREREPAWLCTMIAGDIGASTRTECCLTHTIVMILLVKMLLKCAQQVGSILVCNAQWTGVRINECNRVWMLVDLLYTSSGVILSISRLQNEIVHPLLATL